MATIFIATDFSAAAQNATDYGLQLAKELQASTILFNGYSVPAPVAGLGTSISRFDILSSANAALQSVIDQHTGFENVESCSDEGADANTIVRIASEKRADLIVAGMKGEGKTVRRLFGTTALALARQSNIPVLIVPEKANYQTPQTIVIASENSDFVPNLDSLEFLRSGFKLKFYVLHVALDNAYEKPALTPPDTGSQLDEENVFYYSIDGSDIAESLQEFITTHNAQVLAMIPHHHTFFEKITGKSETKEMLFNSEIPILCLPANV